ncbi:MAG TPA: hypothetical protein PLH12_03460 [Pseudomonadales bacterium]|jgi:hypothetical protein|nr:hypothetical protein [Pseudomonadales bacterium]
MTTNNLKLLTAHEPLFSYGRLRSEHTNADAFKNSGILKILSFIRPEALAVTQAALQKDQLIFQKTPNTTLQVNLSIISRQFLWELHSGIMIRTLENITNMRNMLPDTHCHYSHFVNADTHTYEKQTIGINIENICLYLFINLENGEAILQSTKNTQTKSIHQGNSVKICYWQNQIMDTRQ